MSSRTNGKKPTKSRKKLTSTSAVLEVVQQDVQTRTLYAILLDHNTATAHNLSRVPLAINLAETRPCTQHFGVTDLDEVDFMFGTEGFDELDVLCLCARLDEDTQVGLALVESLGALTETASETIMDEGVF